MLSIEMSLVSLTNTAKFQFESVLLLLLLQAQVLPAKEAAKRLTAAGHQPRSAHATACMFFGTQEVGGIRP